MIIDHSVRSPARPLAGVSWPRWLLAGMLALVLAGGAAPGQAAPAPDSFADLAQRLLPAVVNISTTQTQKTADRGADIPQFPQGSPFEEFFRDFMERHGRNSPDAAPRRITALGSGFIIDSSGLVVTNNHVIADAEEITVILHDEQAYKASVMGRDSKADLAVLKLKDAPSNLAAVTFGNSDEMRVGDWVLAIGNPFGLGGSVTAGIVSARARDINAGPYDDFIQTDAAINKGNSGGPLFNLKGEVIGINTAIFSPSGGSIGIGFSIPSNLAQPIVADLRKLGKTRRGWLGVRVQTVTEEIAENLGLKEAKGALVASLTANGPAAKAGLKPGDVILRFDGKEVPDMRHLPRLVAQSQINHETELQYWRDGRKVTAKVTVGEMPDDEAPAKAADATPPTKDGGPAKIAGLGLSVAPLTQAARERFDLPADAKGVVVAEVDGEGPAAEKGVRPGDMIVEVSQSPVKSATEISAKIDEARKAGRKSVLLLVQNDAGLHYVPVKLASAKPVRP